MESTPTNKSGSTLEKRDLLLQSGNLARIKNSPCLHCFNVKASKKTKKTYMSYLSIVDTFSNYIYWRRTHFYLGRNIIHLAATSWVLAFQSWIVGVKQNGSFWELGNFHVRPKQRRGPESQTKKTPDQSSMMFLNVFAISLGEGYGFNKNYLTYKLANNRYPSPLHIGYPGSLHHYTEYNHQLLPRKLTKIY